MMLIDNIVMKSNIHGKGLFAAETAVKAGDPICMMYGDKGDNIVTPKQYDLMTECVDPSFIRIFGKHSVKNKNPHPEDYINHSDDPTCTYLNGVVFALMDLEPEGKEITVDYRHFLHPKEFVNLGYKLLEGIAWENSVKIAYGDLIMMFKKMNDNVPF